MANRRIPDRSLIQLRHLHHKLIAALIQLRDSQDSVGIRSIKQVTCAMMAVEVMDGLERQGVEARDHITELIFERT